MPSTLVPSGSGQAMISMPILTPLADMVGVTRQVAVQAYQFGDGFTNSIFLHLDRLWQVSPSQV